MKQNLTPRERVKNLTKLISDCYDLNFSQKVLGKFKYQLHQAHIEYRIEKDKRNDFYQRLKNE